MSLLRKLYRTLYYIKKRDRLPRIPRQYAVDYAPRQPHEIERAFKHTAARSPQGVKVMMRRMRAKDLDDLIAKLPRHRRPSVIDRFRRWVNRVDRTTQYEPHVKPFIRQLIRDKVIDRRDRVIRRTQAPKVRL